jgi:hypothetical protein
MQELPAKSLKAEIAFASINRHRRVFHDAKDPCNSVTVKL